MDKVIYVSILDRHIQAGVRKSETLCPVALCLREKYPGHSIVVEQTVTTIEDDVFLMSDRLIDQVSLFDEGGVFRPGRYRLTIEPRE